MKTLTKFAFSSMLVALFTLLACSVTGELRRSLSTLDLMLIAGLAVIGAVDIYVGSRRKPLAHRCDNNCTCSRITPQVCACCRKDFQVCSDCSEIMTACSCGYFPLGLRLPADR